MMIKVVAVCGAGVGSSMMLRLFSQQILDNEGIDAEVDASDVGSVNPASYDIIVTTSDFADVIRGANGPIVRIDNMMDKKFLKEELMKAVASLNA